MASKPFIGYQCWDNERIAHVINKEAVSVEKSDFLATHAPLNKIHYEKYPQEILDRSEAGLLEELHRCDREERHAFVVVQGIPGTGKSHLIRWLKEMYMAHNHENNDVVILIERAQCTLRGTLLQIIKSEAFNNASMQNQLEKLRTATDKLSSETLSETILDQIRNATSDVDVPEEYRPRPFIRKRVKHFLQDICVREYLSKPGGPIDRIKRYLSTGENAGVSNREIPGFEASDFEFDVNVLYSIKNGGYKEARELADKLYDPEEIEFRQELANYFNRLLNYAVGRTTALSADDLKQIFHDLRRQLRRQNRQLALFIEDITAFTGIDEGLIDVLATQHTGEGNREFCRLISVIGITDNYFHQHFPDNMQERVTHRLTLNAITQGNTAADLLQSPDATADISARYLNAIRLSQEELSAWVSQDGARIDRLPDACDTCEFKATCHSAFGSVNINVDGGEPKQVGLYPFNNVAIWTMYRQLSSTNTPLTPRSLLSSVLAYVLESHGTKLLAGEFPPPAREVGSDFKPPSLRKNSQQSLLQSQAGKDTQRLESLVLYWGSRTIDATSRDPDRLVSGLPKEVFQAFKLPFIEGEPPTSYTASTDTFTKNDGRTAQNDSDFYHSNKPADVSASVSPRTTTRLQTGPLTLQEPEQPVGRYTEDINAWLNGAKLQKYENLTDWLVTFIRTAIDWEIHGISSSQARERVQRSNVMIQDQAGRVTNLNERLVFERSSKLAAVLEAVDYLNDNSKQPDKAKLGGYLAFLSSWLDEQEERIIAFVKRPTGQWSETRSFTSLLLLNCILLACLQGSLEYKPYTPLELLLFILKDCVKPDSKQWSIAIEEATKTHSKTWISLMKGVDKKDSVQVCRRELLQALNKPQGGSTAVRFIDIALALDILQEFEKNQWQLTPLEPIGNSASPKWTATVEVYNSLAKNFTGALSEDRQLIEDKLKDLQDLVGDSEPKIVFESINAWIKQMRDLELPYKLEYKPSFNATRLSKIKSTFEMIVKERRTKSLFLRLSEVNTTMKDAQELFQFLTDFVDEVNKQLVQLKQQERKLREETANMISSNMLEQEYEKLFVLLSGPVKQKTEVVQ